MRSLERRIAVLEARAAMNTKPIVLVVKFRARTAEDQIPIRIVGGGGVWTPEPGEDVDAFRQRAIGQATPNPNCVAVLIEEYA